MRLDSTRTYQRTRQKVKSGSRMEQTSATVQIDAWGLAGLAILALFATGKFKIPFLSN